MSLEFHLAPTIVGSGFVALDILHTRLVPETRYFAGGTCGNVLSVLAYLGWDAYPIARLANDEAGGVIRDDLMASGVHPDFLNVSPAASSPIVIQTNKTRQNKPAHTCLVKC